MMLSRCRLRLPRRRRLGGVVGRPMSMLSVPTTTTTTTPTIVERVSPSSSALRRGLFFVGGVRTRVGRCFFGGFRDRLAPRAGFGVPSRQRVFALAGAVFTLSSADALSVLESRSSHSLDSPLSLRDDVVDPFGLRVRILAEQEARRQRKDDFLEERKSWSAPFRFVFRLASALMLSLEIWWRTTTLSLRFFPLLVLYPICMMWMPHHYRGWWFDLLGQQMRRSGPCIVKLGQWLSTRRDIVPMLLCRTLLELQSNASEHSFTATRMQFEREFGVALEDVFSHFPTKPIASGAVAQVYKARLRKGCTLPGSMEASRPEMIARHDGGDGGEDGPVVAVKVRHPGIDESMKLDLFLLAIFGRLWELVQPQMKWLQIPEQVDVFHQRMHAQCNFEVEALNILRFRENFKEVTTVRFPTPIIASPSILVETFEPGEHIETFNLAGVPEEVRLHMADALLDMYNKMVFVDRFVHADLHPGNLLVHVPGVSSSDDGGAGASESMSEEPSSVADGVEAGAHGRWRDLRRLFQQVTSGGGSHADELQIVVLDCGLITDLSRPQRKTLIEMMLALSDGDSSSAGHILSRGSDLEGVNMERYQEELDELVQSVRTKGLGDQTLSQMLGQTLDTAQRNHIVIHTNYSNLIISCIVVEGILLRLDPDMNMLSRTKPVLLADKEIRSIMLKHKLNKGIFGSWTESKSNEEQASHGRGMQGGAADAP